MFQKGPKAGNQLLSRRQVFFPPHPRTGPFIEIANINGEIRRRGSGAVYGGGLLPCCPFRHGSADDFKPLPPFFWFRLPTRPLQSRIKRRLRSRCVPAPVRQL